LSVHLDRHLYQKWTTGCGQGQFCILRQVNSGTCKAKVEDNQPHPGCNCPEEFAGDHCEFLKGNVPDSTSGAAAGEDQSPKAAENTSVSSDSNNHGLVIAVSVCLVAIFAITALVFFRQKRKQGKEDFSVNTSNISFSAETEPSRPVLGLTRKW
jgi:hypothetical protein